MTFRVPNELDGQRLDRFLEWRIPRLDREKAIAIAEACAVHDDGRPRPPFDRVRRGEHVRLIRERFVEPAAPREFAVLHADDALVVVDKPAGLPVHPSATYHRNTLTTILGERFGVDAPHITHRLDKETSGIVVCARRGADEVFVKKQFEQRRVAKTYVAIVRGEALVDQRIDRPIRRAAEGLHMCMEVHPEGAEAVTDVRVLERRGGLSLVELHPHTGRQHQLRVHLASIGHPIVGDKLYGPGAQAIFLQVAEHGLTHGALVILGHPRHALHASAIELEHPRTHERVRYEAPLPEDMATLLEQGLE